MLWLYAHFPTLALDLYSRGQTHQQAMVIVEHSPQKAGHQVLMANKEAKEHGIEANQALHTAIALNPKLHYAEFSPERCLHELQALAQCLYYYCPQVAIFPPDGLLLEIGSLKKLHQGSENIWSHLGQYFQEQELNHHMAIAHSPKGARLLARTQQGRLTEDRDTIQLLIQQCHLTDCELPGKCAETMLRMGLHNVQQLIHIPVTEINHRFGPEVRQQLDKILGVSPDPQRYYTPPAYFDRHLELVSEVEHNGALRFPLNRLLQDLQQYLYLGAFAIECIRINLEHRDRPATQIEIHTAQPETQHTVLLQLGILKLEQIKLTAPITGIRIRVDHLIAHSSDQHDLFEQGNTPEEARQFIARLGIRLGKENIHRIQTQNDHRPEFAHVEQAYHTFKPSPLLSGDNYPLSPPRPPWLLPTPQSLNSVLGLKRCGQDTNTKSAPNYAEQIVDLKQHGLEIILGPERIYSNWWTTAPVNRDYYVARFPEGAIGWIFRDSSGFWYVHGWFS
ncbi:DinP DNA polymerase-like protein [Oleiphilus messinensis]|uniref:DinP DNA polymerase-like protein n=1 Tax=Oleiphilus messinensis TaxID=141451 RepID=A0A1Y0IA57_9GAMM|nr:DNA polymerase Y family protein [Oleiphilus messinensis]ARU57130.1 DinP DNA polymerase-like protein [Oleiphilus messinensis]